MSRINDLRQLHNVQLELCCKKNNVAFTSVQYLLNNQRSKKLLKRNTSMQQLIETEINKAINNEDQPDHTN
jgi:hypothetical protein